MKRIGTSERYQNNNLKAIIAYSKFLARNLNVKLDEPKIYSSFLNKGDIDENNLSLSFDDNNKLNPVKWLTDTMGKNEFVILVTNFQMIRELIEFVLGILPIVFTVLALILPSYSNILKSLT